MTVWALIPCSKSKADQPCSAREMYWPSELFRGAFETAIAQGQRPLIVSALYGLLQPDQIITPYDVTLKGQTPFQRRHWAAPLVFGDGGILSLASPGDSFVSYMGENYAQYVVGFLRGRGYTVEEPLKGMKQGARKKRFREWRSA